MFHSPSPRTYFAFSSFLLSLYPSISMYLLVLSLVLFSTTAVRSFFLLLSLSVPFDICFFLVLLLRTSPFHFLRSARVPFFLFRSLSLFVCACRCMSLSICFSLFRPVVGQIGSRRPAVKFILLPCTATMITASAF